ncbi:YkgJ family cysteine cluster protein [Paenibacillus sp. FSL R7-0652]|uniref:YkgJ family cysteine cluster protein n=1 Tax=Paenibacillus sp. AN1007 TaxID=3151385 RepID=A0AAU8NHB3_9BACL
MECRAGCAACCIAISISSPIPGMPEGKPAGIRCVQLTEENRCGIFGREDRPAVCSELQAAEDMCGLSDQEAFDILTRMEEQTAPSEVR